MPIYQFQCTGCSLPLSMYLPMDDRDTEQKCPECGGKLQRELSAFIAKGLPNGFHASRATKN